MSFLKFTGDSDDENYYRLFKMENEEDYKSESINIPSPIIDNNFKQVFRNNPEITKSLLNSLIYPVHNSIDEVIIISGELPGKINKYPEPANTYSQDSLRADILCKCILKDEIYDEEQNNSDHQGSDDDKNQIREDGEQDNLEDKNIILIDIEMQIGSNTNTTRKFIDYAKRLDYMFRRKVIVLSLAFNGSAFPRKNKGFKINLEQKSLADYKNIIEYDDYIIYQIDLDYCRKLISEKKDNNIWILDKQQKINDSSKEWIKYLTLPMWCDCIGDYYYIFPILDKKFFLTKEVYKAFKILNEQNDINYYRKAREQEDRENLLRQYIQVKKEAENYKEEAEKKDKKIKEIEKEKNKKIKEIEKEKNKKIKEIEKEKNKEKQEMVKEIEKLTRLLNENGIEYSTNSSQVVYNHHKKYPIKKVRKNK